MTEKNLSKLEWIVVVVILGLLALFVISGCTTVHYNPETHDVDVAVPPWGRKIKKIEVLRETDGSVIFTMEDYNSEAVGDIVGSAVEGAVRGMK